MPFSILVVISAVDEFGLLCSRMEQKKQVCTYYINYLRFIGLYYEMKIIIKIFSFNN